MKAVFVELPPFERYRADYLDDDSFRRLQRLLGLRVIYYWWDAGSQFWLFTIYDKDEISDLSKSQRETLKQMIKKELEARRKQ